MPSTAVLDLVVNMKGDAEKSMGGLGSSLAGLINPAALATAGVAALGAVVLSGIQDAREQAKINAQTAATITSMGNAAGVSALHVQEFASSLSDASGKSLFPDSAIQESTNLLLTFGEIKGAALDTATALTVDLATALGGSPRDSAMMLGKALNDPIHGMTALGKAGLTFTDEQKAMIASMQESGDMAGAQALIMEELNKQVGGSAAAAAEADGGWTQFTAQLGEAKESIGAALLPILNKLFGFLNDTIIPVVQKVVEWFSGLTTNFGDVSDTGGELSTIMEDLGKIAMPLLAAGGEIVAGLWKDVLQPALMTSWEIFKNWILPVIALLIRILSIVLPPVIETVKRFLVETLFPALHKIYTFIQENVVPIFAKLVTWLKENIPPAIERVVSGWDNLKKGLASFKETYIDPIIKAFGDVVSAVAAVRKPIDDFIATITSVQIPDWLQGHSPPPLANWLSAVADAAKDVTGAAGDIRIPGIGALPSLSPSGGGGAPVSITVGQIVVQGAGDPAKTAQAVRDELIKLGQRNLDIFGGLA